MHSLTCVIQAFDPPSDTCSVEVRGLGIIDAWLDGVAIAPTVDRAFIVGGAPGVITLPDINRMCDATLIQVTPPGDPGAYDPDEIVTYTGSLLIPTDLTGAGCTTVTFPTPYATPPYVSASAAHPAAVTISNITESGFTACVTGGKVSSKHSVTYSAKSSKTATATKNKALTVDHNLTEVGTHYILDFEDGDVVFTVESHDSPARNQVAATLSDDFKKTLGGAGGPMPCAKLTTSVTGDSDVHTTWLGSQNTGITGAGSTPAAGKTSIVDDPITGLDTVVFDTASFVQTDLFGDGSNVPGFKIPTGMGGKYLIGMQVAWEIVPAADATALGEAGTDLQFYDSLNSTSNDNKPEGADLSQYFIYSGPGSPASVGSTDTNLTYLRVADLLEGDLLIPMMSLASPYRIQITTVTFWIAQLLATATETIEHNGTKVGSEPILDFEDTATVTWTITDDPATKTITISADAAGGSGGGSHNGEIGTIVFNDGDIDPTTATYLTVNTGASTIPAWITITTSSLPNDTIHIATGYAALVNAVCSFDAGTGGDPVDFVLDSSAGHLDQVNGTVPLSCGLSASINSSVNNLQLRADNNGFDYNHVAGCKIRLTCIASP